MIRCLKTTFYASYETIDRLFDCNRVSAEVWNHCLALAKEKHLKTGEWVTKSELQKATKELYLIHSQLFKQFAINIFTLENPHMPQEELASIINIRIIACSKSRKLEARRSRKRSFEQRSVCFSECLA